MKKIISLFVCLSMLICMFAIAPSASAVKLSDGGASGNTGEDYAWGYTSGGDRGKMAVYCSISASQGGVFSNDSTTATITSDVRSGFTVTLRVVAWYTTTSGGESSASTDSSDSISDAGFSVTATAANDYMYEGTGGYSVSSTDWGSWICGTTIEV